MYVGCLDGWVELQNMLTESHAFKMWLCPSWVSSLLFKAENLIEICKMCFQCGFVLILTNRTVRVPVFFYQFSVAMRIIAILPPFFYVSIFIFMHRHSSDQNSSEAEKRYRNHKENSSCLEVLLKPIFFRPSKERHKYIILWTWVFSEFPGSYRTSFWSIHRHLNLLVEKTIPSTPLPTPHT